MPSPVELEIRARLESLVSELTALIHTDALERLGSALEGEPTSGTVRARTTVATSSRRKGAKRAPKELNALVEQLGAFVVKRPGLRIEQIGKALGIATRELVLPVKKLLRAKRISTKGQRRATTYYPAGAGRRAAAAPAKGRQRVKRAKSSKSARKPVRRSTRTAKKVKPKARTKVKAKVRPQAPVSPKPAAPPEPTASAPKTEPTS